MVGRAWEVASRLKRCWERGLGPKPKTDWSTMVRRKHVIEATIPRRSRHPPTSRPKPWPPKRRERQAYTKREQFPTRHDKAMRAQSIRGRTELVV
jgi:hypothetical protein